MQPPPHFSCRCRWLAVVLVGCRVASLTAAEDPFGNSVTVDAASREPTAAAPEGVVDLPGAGFLPGVLRPVAAEGGAVRSTLVWQAPGFLVPFEFRLDGIAGVRFAPGKPPPAPPDRFSLGLRGGDVLSGRMISVDGEQVTILPTGHPPDRPLRIDRNEVVRIGRRAAWGGTFVGPGGLVGWKQSPAASWREEAGRILTTMRAASVVRDVSAPVRARYEIVLSWKRRPEFRLAVAADEMAANDGYWLEMLAEDGLAGVGQDDALEADGRQNLMLVRREADLARIQPLPGPAGNLLRLVLFVDQAAGRLAAILPDAPPAAARGAPHEAGGQGRAVFDVVLPPKQPGRSPLFRLTLTRGDICLESLRVTPWKADVPTLDDMGDVVVTVRDGVHAGAVLERFDSDSGEFVFNGADGPLRVAADAVEEIVLPTTVDEPRAAPAVRAIGVDGDMLAGDLVAVDETAVWLRRPGCDGPVGFPLASLLALKTLDAAPEARPPAARVGRLVSDGFEMQGCLVPAPTGGIAWQPLGSVAGAVCTAAFVGGDGGGPAAATLEYVTPAPPAPGDDEQLGGIGGMVSKDAEGFFVVSMMTDDGAAARDGRITPGDRILAIAPGPHTRFVDTTDLDSETVTNLLRGRVGVPVRLRLADGDGGRIREIGFRRGMIAVAGPGLLTQAVATHARLAAPPPAAATAGYPALLYLRNGDVTACRVTDGTAKALELATPLSTAPDRLLDVDNERVKAIELIPSAASRTLDATRRDRLLTLPRMQRSRPPTHLLRLVDGDYLRGWLLGISAETVRFEVLGTVKQLPRETVARIIWLHPDEIGDGGDGEKAEVVDAPAAPAREPRALQAAWSDARRATLIPATLEGNVLVGESPALGMIRIDLGQVDQLRFGKAIDADAEQRPFSQWRLKPAPDPRARIQPAGAAVPSSRPQGSGQTGSRHSSRHGSSGTSTATSTALCTGTSRLTSRGIRTV
jgi:hypothetical protein